MQPEEASDRKIRVLIALISAVVGMAFLGNFFWPVLKDLHQVRSHGSHGSNIPLLIFGGFFLVMILAMVFSVVWAIRKPINPSLTTVAGRPADSKPWLVRPDWAAGKIKSSAGAQTKMFAVMALAFCGFGGLFVFTALPKELQKGNTPALIGLIFPAIGIGFLIAFLRATLAHRRFGDCFFELAQIPAPLGGTLEGMIQTGARLQVEHGLHLKFSCVRRTVSGSGKNRSVNETVLWQDEKVFKPEAALPEAEPGHSGIPVFFKLPADQPECFARGNESVFWRLEAKAKMRGPDFSVVFDVPVFKVASAILAGADEADPTAALQEPIDEIRRDENSRIKISDDPNGREFYFPAARNLVTVFGLTGFLLVWSGFLYFILRAKNVPVLFPIAFGMVDFFLLWACFNLWFKSSRVTINPSGVTIVNRWLIFSRTRKFDAGQILRFDLKAGMTSGTQVFQDIKLIKCGGDDDFAARKARFEQTGERPPLKFSATSPGGITIAGGIAGKPEADWLVAEMTKALGRRPENVQT
jgi:hypothetical protein